VLASDSRFARVNTQRREFVFGSLVALMAILTFLIWRLTSREKVVDAPVTVVRSLVVLPLAPIDGQRSASLGFGISDELATALASVPGLRIVPVPPSLSFRPRTSGELRELATLLNAGSVLHGTVQRVNAAVHVTLQLRSIADDSIVWSMERALDTTELHELVNELEVRVANTFTALFGLPGPSVLAVTTSDPVAHSLALQASYLRHRADRAATDSAIDLLEQAVQRDSTYARAWSALAALLATMSDSATADADAARRGAISAARRAIAIESALAEPHVVLARVHAARADTIQALREYRVAIRLDPRLASARYGYSRLLSLTGRSDEALREARRAHELDPLSSPVHLNYAEMLARAGHDANAKHEMAELRRIGKYLSAHK
jgi:serine/threonine-protein kinase